MKELVQQQYWVHTRGVQILLAPHATSMISEAVAPGNQIPPTESARLRIITNDHILRTRFPNPNDGVQLMTQVDMERREELLGYAYEITPKIVEEWEKINPNEPIAVVVYGSVAKGLVKPKDHDEPSDLDMSVIGNITEKERRKLLEASIPHRERIQQQMGITPQEGIKYPTLSCFKIRDTRILLSDNYSLAKKLIASSTFATHDPSGILQKIESEVLAAEWSEQDRKTRTFYKKSSLTRSFDDMEKEISRAKRNNTPSDESFQSDENYINLQFEFEKPGFETIVFDATERLSDCVERVAA